MNVLTHYGVLGMKWGVHKQKEADYRKKLSKIAEGPASKQTSRNWSPSDVKRAKYRNQHVAVRITKTAATIMAQQVIGDVLTGSFDRYKNMNKKDIAKQIAGIATKTAANVALNDALAKSMSNRYTQDGKFQPGKKNRIISKEDAISYGVNIGTTAVSYGSKIAGMKLSKAVNDRKTNEARFNQWGQNILPQSVENVVWSNSESAVIDNRKR